MPRKKCHSRKKYTPRKTWTRSKKRRGSRKILPGGPSMKYMKARIASVTPVAINTQQVWQTVRYGIPW